MARVIAVQEEQIRMIKEKYKSSATKIEVPVTPASVISGVFDNVQPTQNIDNVAQPTFVTEPKVDMENSVVSLNTNPVDNGLTNKVFGSMPSVDAMPNQESVMPTAMDNAFFSMQSNTPLGADLPYQEPVIVSNAPVNAMSNDEYVKYINSLRDKLTLFYNDMNSELDKIQEQILQSSSASLVENANNNEVSASIEMSNNSLPTSNLGDGNIFDAQPNFDETMVIPREAIDNAMSVSHKVA